MPTKAEDTVKKEVLYPDDLPGEEVEIDAERLNGEIVYFDAGDRADADRLPDGAQYGYWLPVKHVEYGEVWAASPRALREEIISTKLEPGDRFEVIHLKPPAEENDPYGIEIAVTTP